MLNSYKYAYLISLGSTLIFLEKTYTKVGLFVSSTSYCGTVSELLKFELKLSTIDSIC